MKEEFHKNGIKALDFNVVESQDSDQDPRIIEIHYPNVITPNTDYIKPRILLEIGCRSLREPFSIQSFGSLVDEIYAGRDFAAAFFKVPSVNPERTFLEKLFLLHEEFNRPIEKMRVNRLSRHLYDVYHLSKAGIAEKAIQDKGLYETVVAHRFKFSRVSGVDYNNHNPKTLNPIPSLKIINVWKSDYSKMLEDMIYEEDKPTFEVLIENMNNLKQKLQELKWDFELKFRIG